MYKGKIEISNPHTNDIVCELKVLDLSLTPQTRFELNRISIERECEISFTIENTIISDIDAAPALLYDCVFSGYKAIGYKQAKTHRKKRINKKWLKKYGYKKAWRPFHRRLKECYITADTSSKDTYTIEGSFID